MDFRFEISDFRKKWVAAMKVSVPPWISDGKFQISERAVLSFDF